jgi:hypothetical protein
MVSDTRLGSKPRSMVNNTSFCVQVMSRAGGTVVGALCASFEGRPADRDLCDLFAVRQGPKFEEFLIRGRTFSDLGAPAQDGTPCASWSVAQ